MADRVSVSHITDDMVKRASAAFDGRLPFRASKATFVRGPGARGGEPTVDETGWQAEQARVDAQNRAFVARILSAGLAGYTPVVLPEPDARTVRAFVEYWNGKPETLPQEERFALQKLADIREARRLAGRSQVGDQHGD